MSKIPVFATVSRTYGFLLGDLPTIVRLTWAPFLLASGLSYVYGPGIMDATIAAKDNPDALMALAPMQLLLGLAGFLTGIIATVALLRVVLFGDRKPGLFVYLWFGGAELRLVIVSILLLVAIIAGAIGVALVLALLGGLSAAVPGSGALVGILAFALVPLTIWVALRLTLIWPVVVAENNLGVERSWQLMSGNALRMLGVLLLTFLPYTLVALFAAIAVMGADFPALPQFPAMGGADAAAATERANEFRQAMETWQLDLTKAVRKNFEAFTVLGFVTNVVSTALTAGIFGNAYNAVADHQPGN
jgi:hypothetical protein